MITTDQADTIVQLTEEESKRAADALIESYGTMCKNGTIAFIAMAGAYIGYLAYGVIRDIVEERKHKKFMREVHDQAVCGEDTNA